MLILLLLAIVAATSFWGLNQNRIVERVNVGFRNYTNVPLSSVILWAFGLGVIWTAIIAFLQEIRLRIKINRLKNYNRLLQQELDELRIVPLESALEEKEKK